MQRDASRGPFDVVVVGAGPSGSAAAIAAAAAGLSVALVDKATFPRDKTCGDGLTAQALRLLEQCGIEVPALSDWVPVRETVIVTPQGRRIALQHPRDGHHAGVVPRAALDAELLARAEAQGASLRLGTAMESLEAHDNVEVHLAGGTTIRARFAVAADGHWSPTRRFLGEPSARYSGEWHATRQYYADVADPGLQVIFDADLLPGYAWVFPLSGGAANVGFGVLRERRTGRELSSLAASLADRPAIRRALGGQARAVGPLRAWPIPGGFSPSRLVASESPRVLFAGDAAGAVDPMTGEGIAQALETGMLAAEAVARGGTPAEVARRYTNSVRRHLGADLRFAGFLQRVIRTRRGTQLALRAVDLSPWTRRNFARWMWEDYPRALLLTPTRWHRGMLAPRGAFAGSAAAPASPAQAVA